MEELRGVRGWCSLSCTRDSADWLVNAEVLAPRKPRPRSASLRAASSQNLAVLSSGAWDQLDQQAPSISLLGWDLVFVCLLAVACLPVLCYLPGLDEARWRVGTGIS